MDVCLTADGSVAARRFQGQPANSRPNPHFVTSARTVSFELTLEMK